MGARAPSRRALHLGRPGDPASRVPASSGAAGFSFDTLQNYTCISSVAERARLSAPSERECRIAASRSSSAPLVPTL